MEPAQQLEFTQLRLEQGQKTFPRQIFFEYFPLIVTHNQNIPQPREHLLLHCFCNRPYVGISTVTHVSVRFKLLVSDHFIPKGPKELLWLVKAQRPVFWSLKLAPIKYEKSFVPRHIKSEEGPSWKSVGTSKLPLPGHRKRRKSPVWIWLKKVLNERGLYPGLTRLLGARVMFTHFGIPWKIWENNL